jgi:hypothetical protein
MRSSSKPALLALVTAAVVMGNIAPGASASTVAGSHPVPPSQSTPSSKPELSTILGSGWTASTDVAIETSEDSAGYHVFVAHGRSGFAWQPLATLLPADTDAQSWTGYSCLTGSGDYAVSVVAPADYTNVPTLRDRGAFAYVTTVSTGATRPIAAGLALKYYSPGCGGTDTAILTRDLGSDQSQTQLITIDAVTAAITGIDTLPGQVTSAVPSVNGSILAARGAQLVRVSGASVERTVGHAGGQVYDIAADAGGTATFLVADGAHATVTRMSATGTLSSLAVGDVRSTNLHPGRAGHPVIIAASLSRSIPTADAAVVTKNLPAVVDGASLEGQIVVGRAKAAKDAAVVEVTAAATGVRLPTSAALPPPAAATTALPKTVFSIDQAAPHTMSVTHDGSTGVKDPGCAMPRLSPTMQVPQPGRSQVERAVDLAVSGQLLDSRPANYLNMGLASYRPSIDFPPHALAGNGFVPAQVYLGILAQESNMDQASWHALPGIAGDPLIADYYGSAGSISVINYIASDCGYGIGQITTGMDNHDTSVYSLHGQMKIATDYEENIAAGLQILEDKWDQLSAAGIKANSADPSYIENWYFAIWAYNTGIQPNAANGNTTGCTPGPSCTDGSGNWGLGWTNNPANPDYKPGRAGFLDASYADAAHPGDWPYQERVFGWINHPQHDLSGNDSYAGPTYGSAQPSYIDSNGDVVKTLNQPFPTAFCSTASEYGT